MLAARLMPGVPATGLHYVADVAALGYLRSPRRWCSAPGADGPIRRAASGSVAVAREDPDRRSTDRGWCGDGPAPGATPPKSPAATGAAPQPLRKSTAAAALLRDRRRSPASCVTSP